MSYRNHRTKHCSIEIYNEGASVPILFLHGYPLDGTFWSNQVDYFRNKYTIAVVDLRGFGKSADLLHVHGQQTDVSHEYSMASLADDCIEAMDGSQLHGRMVVCGLSMGGYIAFEMWKRHRSRIAAMILSDTRSVADTPDGMAQRISIAERVLHEGTRSVVMPMIPKLLAPETQHDSPDVVAKLEKMICSVPPETIAAAQRAMASRQDFTSLLDQIQVPVSLVVGESDAISNPEEMRGIADRISNARLHRIERAGHLPPLENPRAFNRIVDEFLSDRSLLEIG